MKRVLVLIMAVFVGLTASFAKPSFIKSVANDKSIVVNLESWKSSEIVLTIKNDNGVTLHSETLKDKNAKKYNLAKLEDGQYNVVIENDQRITRQSVEIKGNSITVAPLVTEVFKPVFITNKGDVWSIQALNLEKDAAVKIVDEDGNVVFTETIAKPTVERKYNVSKLGQGEYEIIYTTSDYTFSHLAFKK